MDFRMGIKEILIQSRVFPFDVVGTDIASTGHWDCSRLSLIGTNLQKPMYPKIQI